MLHKFSSVTVFVLIVVLTVFPQKLPENFEYKRETGQESGVPYFMLTPRIEAMTYDAVRGNTFEALGALVQPERDKYGLIFYNAKESYQLQRQKAKGATLRVDGVEYKIPNYVMGEQKQVGRLKLETATIPIGSALFWKLAGAKDVFSRVGSVAYSLDEDNVVALQYYAAEIKKDIARRKETAKP